jgi:hypothetical protein
VPYYYSTTRFRDAVAHLRVRGLRNAAMAQQVGAHPSWTSNIVAGSRPARRDDPRIVRLLKLTSLSFDEAFQPVAPVDELSGPETAA